MKPILTTLLLCLGGVALSQPKPPEPPGDTIVLTPAEWKALQEQIEWAKKVTAAKPVAPSSCAVRVRIEMRGDKPVAVLTATFGVRTTTPRAVVALGLQKAHVTAARGEGNRLPVLNPPGDDGLTVLFETVGEHTLTLELETAVAARGRGELGFDIGLPRAAITTLTVEQPPATAAKKLAVGTRTDGKGTDAKRVVIGVEQLARPFPLGATDTLELAWEPPTTVAPAAPTVEADVVVTVDDSQVETVAKLWLRGPKGDWQLALPPGADVTATSETASAAPTITRPADAGRHVWTIRGPVEPTADWLVTVTTRQPRPKPTEAKFRGPYPLGPFAALGGVKSSGKVTVFAPPTARLSFKGAADFRRQDVPAADAGAAGTDGPVAVFRFTSLPAVPNTGKPPAWLELDARAVPVQARVRPAHALTLRADGWHWEATVKVVPPPRGEVEQVLIELPAGWETLTAKPEELVDEVQGIGDGSSTRTRLIRLTAPQKAAFDLTLTSRFPVAVSAGRVSLPLPQFPQADERDGTVTATVPDEFEVNGSAAAAPLKPPAGRRPPVVSVSGELDRNTDRVELNWQPHRPDISCEARAEVTVTDQQTVVTQVLKFRTPGDGKPIRLRGPTAAVGLKAIPAVDPIGPGEWEFRPPAEGEFMLALGYALRNPARKGGTVGAVGFGELPVGLFAPVPVTRHDTTARVWLAATGRRLDAFTGTGWRELPPEPAPDRETLPAFTLTATGAPPLTVTWTDAADTGPAVTVDRALVVATLADDGTAAVRGRFVLRKWPAGGIELDVPADATASIYADGKRIDPQPAAATDRPDERTVRLTLPELKPGRATVLLDVRYLLPARAGGRAILPPTPRGATYRAAVRWHVTAPAGSVPLLAAADWQPDTRWGVRWNGLSPTAGLVPSELEQWLTGGADADPAEAESWLVSWAGSGGETVAARQAVPGRVTVRLVPRVGWVAGVSATVLLLGLGLSRLRSRWCGPAVATAGVLAAVGAAVAPQPAAQVFAGMQFGLLALGLVLAGLFAWRVYAWDRINRLPAFTRTRASATAVPALSAGGTSGQHHSNRGPSAEVRLDPDSASKR